MMGTSDNAFPIRRCFCVSKMAAVNVAHFLVAHLFLPSTRVHNIPIYGRNIAFNCYGEQLCNHSKQTRL